MNAVAVEGGGTPAVRTEPRTPSTARRRWRRLLPPAVVRAHVATLVLFGGILAYVVRNQWFYYDDWDFVARRGFSGRPLDLFTPHNEHWSTVPILVDRTIFAVVGARTYLPYVGVLVALDIVLVHLLWRLAIRGGANPWVATALTPLVLVYGDGWQNLVWAFQIGFVGSLVAGLAAVLVATGGGMTWRRLLVVNAILIAGLMCSGVGVSMVAIAGLVVLLTSGVRPAVATVLPPAVVYISWFAAIGHTGAQSGLPRGADILLVPAFAWTGMTGALDDTVGVDWLGALALLALAAWVGFAVLRAGTRRVVLPLAFLAGDAAFFLLSGVSRWSMGVDYATSPRYLFTGVVFALPAAVAAATALVARRREAALAVLVVATVIAAHGTLTLRQDARNRATNETADRDRLLAAAALVDEQPLVLSDYPDPDVSPELRWTEIVDLVHAGALPTGPPPSAQARLDVAATLFVALDPIDRIGPNLGVRLTTPGEVSALTASGCRSVVVPPGGTFTLDIELPGSLRITPSHGGPLLVTLREGDAASTRTFTVGAGRPAWLEFARPSGSTVVTPPPGETEICQVG